MGPNVPKNSALPLTIVHGAITLRSAEKLSLLLEPRKTSLIGLNFRSGSSLNVITSRGSCSACVGGFNLDYLKRLISEECCEDVRIDGHILNEFSEGYFSERKLLELSEIFMAGSKISASLFDDLCPSYIEKIRVFKSIEEKFYLTMNSSGPLRTCRVQTSAITIVDTAESENNNLLPARFHIGATRKIDLQGIEQAKNYIRYSLSCVDRVNPPERANLILSNEASAIFFHELFGHGLEIDHLAYGHNPFRAKVGQKIGPSDLTIIANRPPYKNRCQLVDGEGNVSRPTTLVRDGILKGFITDFAGAIRNGVRITGNGFKKNFRSNPSSRMYSLHISGKGKVQSKYNAANSSVVVSYVSSGRFQREDGTVRLRIPGGLWLNDKNKNVQVGPFGISGDAAKLAEKICFVGNDSKLCYHANKCGKHGQDIDVWHTSPTIILKDIPLN